MGIRIDGASDLINATDGSLTIEGQSINSTGIGTFSGGVKVGSAATIHSTGQFNIGVAATIFASGNATFAGITTTAGSVVHGRLLVGTDTEGNANADDLTVATTGETGITIRSGSSSPGNIFFSDATSGAGEYAGEISYKHNTNDLIIGVNGAERLRIRGDGRVAIASSLAVTGICTVNQIQVAGDIAHTGDGDTKIAFTDNQIDLQTGGSSRVYANNYAIYVRSGFPLAFLASSGDSPNMKSGGTNAQDLLFTTGSSNPTRLQITSAGAIQVTGTRGGALQPEDDDTLQLYTAASDNSINRGSGITFYNHDNSGYEMGGTIQVAKENGTADNEAAYMRFNVRPAGATNVERLRITSTGAISFNNGELVERCYIQSSPAWSSNGAVDLDNGVVQYNTSNYGSGGAGSLYFTSSVGINTQMSTGDIMSLTMMTNVNSTAGYINNIFIDGQAATETWVGGSAPTAGGGSGIDIYTFNIIKTASATYTVIANQVKTSA